MRTFKFRGKSLRSGEKVFGSLVVSKLRDENYKEIAQIIDENGKIFEVDKDSVMQLVGYDADGNEVYETDMLVDNYGEEFGASADVGLENEKSFTVACGMGDTLFGYRLWRRKNETN